MDKDQEEVSTKESLSEKFGKNKISKKKSFDEIKEESEKKRKEMEGKAFAESDAAQKDVKKKETGYQKIVKKKTKKALEGKIFLIRGKDNGRPAWHYILVPPEKAAELRKQKAGCNIDVAKFGKIVESGWGEDPSQEIMDKIQEEYGDD